MSIQTFASPHALKLHLIKFRDVLADSFWFVPFLMALLAVGAALGSVAIDHAIGSGWVKDIGWVWSGGAEGARGVLTVVAGSLMTVVSIVFSLTITTLAQTASHFGPRVLRNFTANRFVQFTLGTFIATFIYCLLVLRTVRSVEESSFVPYLSVNVGVLLALASLAVLIFFIHHVSQSIQAENLIAAVGADFQETLPVLFPERIGVSREDIGFDSGGGDWKTACEVKARTSGYLQRVDDEQLMRLAVDHDLVLKLEKRPGDFVSEGSPLLRARPAGRMDEETVAVLVACFSIGRHRTPHQDALFSLQQLVEIACHALSPGINEPFTALSCIDWLGASLRGVARRELPGGKRVDPGGRLRVLAPALTFDEIADATFDPIRLYGASNPAVLRRLLAIIREIAPEVHRAGDRQALVRHARLIGQDRTQIVNPSDQAHIAACLGETLQTLSQD